MDYIIRFATFFVFIGSRLQAIINVVVKIFIITTKKENFREYWP